MVDSSRSAAKTVESSAPNVLKAPLFAWLAEQMRGGGRWVILDLGPAHAATINFFNQFRSRLDIADLPKRLDALNAQEDLRHLQEQAEAALPERRNEATDVVLCWDLLNYLQRPALTAVMERVTARTRPGTLIHTLIVYSAPRMPARPSAYSPRDDDRLANVPLTSEQRDAPHYTPDDLRHCMRGYHVKRAMLLSNGMQEFLFRR